LKKAGLSTWAVPAKPQVARKQFHWADLLSGSMVTEKLGSCLLPPPHLGHTTR
jgi:hypothetical protein